MPGRQGFTTWSVERKPLTRFELVTSPLPRECSGQLSYKSVHHHSFYAMTTSYTYFVEDFWKTR